MYGEELCFKYILYLSFLKSWAFSLLILNTNPFYGYETFISETLPRPAIRLGVKYETEFWKLKLFQQI